jgi:hypothetical protein
VKFNMGCGHRRLPGYVNVDASALGEPDVVFDLEQTPWPWADSVATEIRFIHSLEHMGQDAKVFLAIMSEIYRIAADACEVVIHVPHPRHDHFIGDPTHVRAITHDTLKLFDANLCRTVITRGGANSPLALMLGVDFETVKTDTVLEPAYFARLKAGEITSEEAHELVRTQSNVALELRFVMKVRKPSAKTAAATIETA